jgi:hypothetical protein
MTNGERDKVWARTFVLVLLVVAAPLIFSLGAVSDENWLTGMALDFDGDDLRADLLPVSHTLMPQGLVVKRVAMPSLLLSGIPFHPPA